MKKFFVIMVIFQIVLSTFSFCDEDIPRVYASRPDCYELTIESLEE